MRVEISRVSRELRESRTVTQALAAMGTLTEDLIRIETNLTDQIGEYTPVMSTSASQSLRAATEILRLAEEENK